jgi:hypothetical protein
MRAVRACAAVAAVAAIAAAGCDSRKTTAADPTDNGPAVTLWGVDPTDWTCDLVATPAVMAETLGGPTRGIDSPMATAPGTPRPCTFVFEGTSPEAWSFDLDCRANALKTAETLFSEYAAQNVAIIEAFDAQTGGKVVKDDAGVEHGAVEAPREVAVGKKGLDHHGMQILFVDDDAPCYVRVSGPDADRRLAVAQLVARNLTAKNAPMRPYPAPDTAATGK